MYTKKRAMEIMEREKKRLGGEADAGDLCFIVDLGKPTIPYPAGGTGISRDDMDDLTKAHTARLEASTVLQGFAVEVGDDGRASIWLHEATVDNDYTTTPEKEQGAIDLLLETYPVLLAWDDDAEELVAAETLAERQKGKKVNAEEYVVFLTEQLDTATLLELYQYHLGAGADDNYGLMPMFDGATVIAELEMVTGGSHV